MGTKKNLITEVLEAADFYCGAGGTTTGLMQACRKLGYAVKMRAVNHWDIAIATHTKNHRDVEHFCQGINTLTPLQLVPSGRLRLLVASPECTHHSNARGGKPMDDQKRADAWELLRWIEELYVDNLIVENVVEFQDWGPLTAKRRPDKRRKGEYFRRFISLLEVNYNVQVKVLNAANYGDATTRQRLFIIARRPKHKPIVWPAPSHASRETLIKTKSQPGLFGKGRALKPWRTAREIIDWSLEGESIFNSTKYRKRPLKQNTLRRIAAGLMKYSGIAPFVLPNEGFYRGNAARSVVDPLPTCTTRGAGALVTPEAMIVNLKGTNRSGRSVDAPLFTQCGGNHQYLAQPCLVPVNHGGAARSHDVDQPVPTITGFDAMGVAQPFLLSLEHTKASPEMDAQMPTITTNDAWAMVEPFLLQFFGERAGQKPRTRDLNSPLWTVTAQGRMALAQPFIVKYFTGSDAAPVEDPLPTVTANYEHLALAQPFLVHYNGSHKGRADGDRRTGDVDEPVRTLDTSNRVALAQPFLLPHQHGSSGDKNVRDIERPMPTITGTSADMFLAQPFLVKYNGTGGALSVDDPLDTITGKDKFGLCIPQLGAILDIKFRMLQPHELAAAHSFPRKYVFTGTRDQRVKQIGNSVPVRLARALVTAVLTADRLTATPPKRSHKTLPPRTRSAA